MGDGNSKHSDNDAEPVSKPKPKPSSEPKPSAPVKDTRAPMHPHRTTCEEMRSQLASHVVSYNQACKMQCKLDCSKKKKSKSEHFHNNIIASKKMTAMMPILIILAFCAGYACSSKK